PVELLTADPSQTDAPATIGYQAVVADLDRRRVAPVLEAALGAEGFALSRRATVFVRVGGSRWVIRDVLEHAGERHTIEYTVDERIDQPNATLVVEARVADMHAANEFFPIQLFFDQAENRVWRGWLFTLASHANEPSSDPGHAEKFQAVLNLLNAERLVGDPPDGVSLIDLFAAEGITVRADARVSLVSSTGSGVDQRRVWRIEGEESYL